VFGDNVLGDLPFGTDSAVVSASGVMAGRQVVGPTIIAREVAIAAMTVREV
jgi:hypothetical protein